MNGGTGDGQRPPRYRTPQLSRFQLDRWISAASFEICHRGLKKKKSKAFKISSSWYGRGRGWCWALLRGSGPKGLSGAISPCISPTCYLSCWQDRDSLTGEESSFCLTSRFLFSERTWPGKSLPPKSANSHSEMRKVCVCVRGGRRESCGFLCFKAHLGSKIGGV